MEDFALVALFSHTGQGNIALKELLDAGVAHQAIQVIGDLGEPAGHDAAMHHVTFDMLHIPQQQREQFMNGIRSGGVVLAVTSPAPGVEDTLRKQGPLLVERVDLHAANPSHNV